MKWEKLGNLFIQISGVAPPGIVTGFEVWNKNENVLCVAFFILEHQHHYFEIFETTKKMNIARVLVENTGQYRVSEDREGTRLELWEAPFSY